MITGNLKCKEINRLLLGYINFELSNKDMSQVAIHLRNCPICMEKYSRLQKRKKVMSNKLKSVEKKIRIENEISSYIDFESDKGRRFATEGMIATNEEYKETLTAYEKISAILNTARREIIRNYKCKNTKLVLKKLKEKNNIIQRFLRQFLFHEEL